MTESNSRSSWLRALGVPAFRRMWVVATLQQLGYWFSSIAFQWLVALRTGSDPLTLSILYFCLLLPLLLFSLPAGALADAHDRRRILLGAQLVILAISVATATLVYVDRAHVWVLLICAFAVGCAHILATPASQALVANSVPPARLRSAVMLQAMGMNLARIAGPALAGVLILVWGTAGSLLTYGALGLLSILVLWSVPRLPQEQDRGPRARLVSRLLSGLRHARSRPPAATTLAIVAMTSLFGASYIAQVPALAARVSTDPSAFLVLTSISGLGSLGGVLTVAVRRVGRPSVTSAAAMVVLLGCTVIGMAFVRVMWLELILITMGGWLQFGIMTQCNSVLQQVVDDDHRGRVSGLYQLCWGGLLPVGGLLLGTGWHLFGPVVALSASGLVTVVFATYILRPGAVRSAESGRPVRVVHQQSPVGHHLPDGAEADHPA